MYFINKRLRKAVENKHIGLICDALVTETFFQRDVLNLFKYSLEKDYWGVIKCIIQNKIRFYHWTGKREQHFNLDLIEKPNYYTVGEEALRKAINKQSIMMVKFLASKIDLGRRGGDFIDMAIDSYSPDTVYKKKKEFSEQAQIYLNRSEGYFSDMAIDSYLLVRDDGAIKRFSEQAQIYLIRNGARPHVLIPYLHTNISEPTQSQNSSLVSRCVVTALERDQYKLVRTLWYHQLFPKPTELASVGLLKSIMMQGNMRMVNFLCKGGYQVGTEEIIDVIEHLQDESLVCKILKRIIKQFRQSVDIESNQVCQIDLNRILEHAVIFGERNLVSFLFRKGASPKVISPSIFARMAEQGAHETIEFLVEHYKFDLSQNHDALIKAAICGHAKTVTTLLKLGVNDRKALNSAYAAVLNLKHEQADMQEMKKLLKHHAKHYGHTLDLRGCADLIFSRHKDIQEKFNPDVYPSLVNVHVKP